MGFVPPRESPPRESAPPESPRIPNPKPRIPSLYAILDADTASAAGWAPVDLARAYLAGGARLVQIRAKGASGAELLDLASAASELAHQAGAIVIVNDRPDIARLARADGVHLGQEDLPPLAVRRIVGDHAIVGVSTHTGPQIDAALAAPISYLAIGPVFATSTKATGYAALGLAGVRQAAARARTRALPLVAIGGITLDNARQVLDEGAASVAVVSDLLSGDPEARVRRYVEALA